MSTDTRASSAVGADYISKAMDELRGRSAIRVIVERIPLAGFFKIRSGARKLRAPLRSTPHTPRTLVGWVDRIATRWRARLSDQAGKALASRLPMSPRRCSTRDGAPQGEGHTPRIEKSAYVGLRLPERESPLFERGLSRRNEASGAPAHRNSCLGIVSQPFANPRREKNSVGYFFFFLPAFFFILALRLGLDLVAFLRAFRFTGIDTSSCYHCCATSTKTNGWSLCFHPPRPIIETRYCAIKRMASIL
jgi:hypothetical protein